MALNATLNKADIYYFAIEGYDLKMPELPEVEITRQKLLPLLSGRKILDFWTDWPRGLRTADGKEQMAGGWRRTAANMESRKIIDIARRGKVLFFILSGQPPRSLAIHLRMSGRLEVAHSSASAKRERLRMRHPKPSLARRRISRPPSSDKWIHFRWRLSGGKELCFIDPRKFGVVWYGSPEDFENDPHLGRLGLDARAMSLEQFFRVIKNHRGMIKPFLLRQDKFAGIGNIIADEALWRVKIHPEALIDNLAPRRLAALHSAVIATIKNILKSGGTSLRDWGHPDGKKGGYQEIRLIYGKSDSPCPLCRTKLQRIIVGGRGTTVCPGCQRQ